MFLANIFTFYYYIRIYIFHINKYNLKENQSKNKLIAENFFIIDSNNLETIESHMYGFTISKTGILTNNYYKNIGYYEEPDLQGAYVMIRKNGNEIRISQDFYGSFGLYFYENKNIEYFALSNSFLMLEEYLLEKQNISFNKDFADNFIISSLCTPSIYETLIKEIIKLASNTVVIINTERKDLKIFYIDYEENTVPLESKEGLSIIDKWVDKWGYIIRSLQKKTNNFSFDLSGGFDSRITLALLIGSGIDIKNISFRSVNDKKFVHDEDFKIANNISSKFGFKLNEKHLENESIMWSARDTLFCTIYSKLGIHKEFYLKNQYYIKPRFIFTGNGGETIRGNPDSPIKKYLEKISTQGIKSFDNKKDFYNSSMKLCKRSVDLLKKGKTFDNDYKISSEFYSKGRARNHFGKSAVEGFIANIYFIQPLIDPDIQRIKFNISGKNSHDLMAYIYLRYAPELILFPFQGNRTLNSESIKKAEKLNNLNYPYKIKFEYNKNFYIDIERKSPVPSSNEKNNVNYYVKKIFQSSHFFAIINKFYNKDVYEWAKEYSKNTTYFPLRHVYGLLAVAMTIDYITFNKRPNNSILIEFFNK